MGDNLTTEEAAELLGYTLRHTQHMLRLGRLAGEKFGRTWIVPRSEVDRVNAARSPGGRYYPDREYIDK